MILAAPHRVVSRIFEEGSDFPVVVHIFYGKNAAAAQRVFNAHKQSDKFLKACVDDKKFGNFTCREERNTERWNGREWVAA